MCFSAPASFAAGSVLSAAGLVTVKKAKKRSELPFAFIPLIFGLQQLTEWLVWISFNAPAVNLIAAYVFLFISHVFWPIYVPLAILLLEKNKRRKKTLFVFFLIGDVVGGYLLWRIITVPFVSPAIINHSIFYPVVSEYGFIILSLYVLATVGSCLISSHKLIKLFGAVLLISFTVSGYCYTETFISVWCYFAAVLSLIVYFFFAKKSRGLGLNP